MFLYFVSRNHRINDRLNLVLDLLKLSDETDLDILNRSMEVMVEAFQTELLPVAAQLTARLVSTNSHLSIIVIWG